MSSQPRVSVIIPCFNLGLFVEEALDSVFEQTYLDFEILVVDDGSTDADTRARLDGLQLPKTRVIRSENRGLSGARNLGIRHSVGRYICSLDADDRLAPSWLERAVALLDRDTRLTFVSHWLEAFGDEQWNWTPGRCDLGMLLDFNLVNGAALFKREIVDAIGGFDESMREGCEDWEFWIRVTEAGYRGAIVPEVHYQYRRRSDSMSRAMNDGDTHLRLYADLVAKHPKSYQRHLVDLVLRRERTFADLSNQIGALDDEVRWLESALDERELELTRGRTRLNDVEARLQRENQVRELQARVRELEERLRELAERAAWLDRERSALIDWSDRLETERNVLATQADDASKVADAWRTRTGDLQRSWSWRITSPLRRLYEAWGARWT
jgi:glycosyltransferase involved in cell wall biosynthesis